MQRRRRNKPLVTETQVVRAVRLWRRNRLAAVVVGLLLLAGVVVDHLFVSKGVPHSIADLDGKTVHVSHVVDGDTIDVIGPDKVTYRVRLKGIDTPEIAHDGKPAAYWGPEATRYTAARCGGKDVTLKLEPPEVQDPYHRVLAIVYLSDTEPLNLALVRDGQAYSHRRYRCYLTTDLNAAEAEARKKKRGLWKSVTTDQMPAWRQSWLKERGVRNGE